MKANQLKHPSYAAVHVAQLYLDYVNNYASAEKFADAWGITNNQALAIIRAGQILNKEFFIEDENQ